MTIRTKRQSVLGVLEGPWPKRGEREFRGTKFKAMGSRREKSRAEQVK